MPLDTLGNGPDPPVLPDLVSCCVRRFLVGGKAPKRVCGTAAKDGKGYLEALSAFGDFGERSRPRIPVPTWLAVV